jgi:peptidoglycan hydrolase CwlO-like protein
MLPSSRRRRAERSAEVVQLGEKTVQEFAAIIPEQIHLMDDKEKWQLIIKLLEATNSKVESMTREMQQMQFSMTRMADDVDAIKEELQNAKEKITEFEKLRIMANGVRAALVAGGGVLAWGASQIWEQFHKK